jgi:hypothetical protein
MSERTHMETADSTRGARRGSTTGGLLLWGGTVSIGASTVIVLAALSRHLHHGGFAGLSTLFGLFFIASLIPSGVPLRAAALVADGAAPMKMTVRQLALLAVAGAAVSPLIAYALRLPVLAVGFVAAQVIVAIPLAIRRGALVAVYRFGAMGGNLFLEGGFRILLGTLLGSIWGMAGLAAGLAVATTAALLAVPTRSTSTAATARPMTSMVHTWLTLVLLGVFVQLDILLAPSGMTKAAATRYDLAAVPSKGIYLILVAVGTLIFPYVRVHASRRTVILSTLATFALGLATTGALVPARRFIATLLGQNIASLQLFVLLGIAMSVAGATGIIVNGGVALGVARPWPPLVLGSAAVFACWLSRPTATTFATVVLVAQVCTFVICTWSCLKRRQSRPALS